MSENEKPEPDEVERARLLLGRHYSRVGVSWRYREGQSLVQLVDVERERDDPEFVIVEMSSVAAKSLVTQLKANADFALAMERLIPAATEAGADTQEFVDAMATVHKTLPRPDSPGLLGGLFGQGLFV